MSDGIDRLPTTDWSSLFVKVIFVGVPIIVILQGVSPNGRFIGLSLLMSTFPLSTMGLILVPKALTIRRSRLGAASGDKRGSRQKTRISGLPADNAASETRTSENGNLHSNDPMQSPSSLKTPKVQRVIIH